MAQEIMVVNGAIANLIREGKTSQMYSAIQTGAQHGMQTLETALANLYKKKSRFGRRRSCKKQAVLMN